MSDPCSCPRCGARYLARAQQELCPRCLLAHGIEGFAGDPAQDAQTAQPGRPATLCDFGDYELLEEIGRGGMGIVYRAWQKGLNRTVALKIILAGRWASEAQVQRFQIEAAAAAALAHPNIVPIYETGQLQGQHFFSMKLVEGGSLAEVFQRRDRRFLTPDPLDPRRNPAIIQILAKVARAVHFGHERRVVHRDLKPTNVLIDLDGEPHLTDFGLAKRLEAGSDLTGSQTILGTPAYMAPEQAAGLSDQVTPSTDIYSLGAILYEALTGQPPFIGRSPMEVLHQVLAGSVQPPRLLNRALPRDLETICLKCLQNEPHRRYATAAELANDLEGWLEGRPIQARPATRPEKLWLWTRRNPAAACAGLLMFLLALGSTLAAFHLKHERDRVRQAQMAAGEKLWLSYLAQAKAERLSAVAGRRQQALDAVSAAAKMRPSLELRNEAIAALAALDLGPPVAWRAAGTDAQAGQMLLRPHSDQYVQAHADGRITLHQVITCNLLRHLAPPGERVVQISFSPDGRYVATAHRRGAVCIWDLENPESSPNTNLVASSAGSHPISFTPGGETLLLAGPNQSVHLYAAGSSLEVGRLEIGVEVGSVAVDPTGQLLAVMSKGDVQIWDLERRTHLRTLSHPVRGTRLAWHPRGRWLAAGYQNGELRLWHATTGEAQSLASHLQYVSSLAFDPRGEFLASQSWDSALRLWDPGTGRQLLWTEQAGALELGHNGEVLLNRDVDGRITTRQIQRSDGFRLVTAVDTEHPKLLAADISRDGRWLIFGEQSGWHLWDLTARQETLYVPCPQRSSPIFHPDNQHVVAVDSDHVVRWRLQGDPPTASSPEVILASPGSDFQRGCLSADGTLLAVAGHYRSVLIQCHDPTQVVDFADKLHQSHVCLSPDRRWVAAASSVEAGVSIWETRDGRLVRHLIDRINARAAFSPDGRMLATATPRECVLWNTQNWEPTHRWPLALSGGVAVPLVFSPDSRYVAVAATRADIRLLDVTTGLEVATLTAPLPQNLEALVFSADGRYLAGHTLARNVHLWDVHALRRDLATLGLSW